MQSPQPATPAMKAIMYRKSLEVIRREIRKMSNSGRREWIHSDDRNLGITPLMGCMFMDDDHDAIRAIQMLVDDFGADINQTDDGPGAFPLYLAAQNGKPKILKYLLENGADITMTPYRSRTTCLFMATQYGFAECAALLANAYMEQNERRLLSVGNQTQGQSPAYKAVSLGHPEILGILAKAGADLRCAFPCWFEIMIQNGERTKNVDLDSTSECPVQYALNATVFSHVHKFCIACRKSSTEVEKLNSCGRCRLANYCSKECQTKDFKESHKKVCKRIRAGMDICGDPASTKIPGCVPQTLGFNVVFAGEDFDTDCWDESLPKWEYNDAAPGEPAVWKRYPPQIEANLESMREDGFSSVYMYRPGDPECEGTKEYNNLSARAPPGVATQYVWFTDMIERDVYNGTARAVRRDGSRDSCKIDPVVPSYEEVMRGVDIGGLDI
ncbi:MAG: hypothetical protein SGILL_008239 [Bacillariaceae sp.]